MTVLFPSSRDMNVKSFKILLLKNNICTEGTLLLQPRKDKNTTFLKVMRKITIKRDNTITTLLKRKSTINIIINKQVPPLKSAIIII